MSLVALDIGNVCVQLKMVQCSRMFGENPPPEFRTICDALNLGLIEPGEWAERTGRILKISASVQEILDRFTEQIGDPVPGMNEIIREGTEHGVRFVFLSDTSLPHMTKIRRTLPFCHLVTGEILSYAVHVCKPSPEIFRIFEKEYGKPDLYADDLRINTDAASALGWKAHCFTTPAVFHEELKKIYEY